MPRRFSGSWSRRADGSVTKALGVLYQRAQYPLSKEYTLNSMGFLLLWFKVYSLIKGLLGSLGSMRFEVVIGFQVVLVPGSGEFQGGLRPSSSPMQIGSFF